VVIGSALVTAVKNSLDEAGRATNSTVKAVTGLVGELARGVRSARDDAKAGAAE
jgi:tryptophan synthase alpha chain